MHSVYNVHASSKLLHPTAVVTDLHTGGYVPTSLRDEHQKDPGTLELVIISALSIVNS